MASATELLSEAQDLTKRAEELEGDIARRREKFEASIAADESKLRDAKAEAQGKIQEAMRLMGASAPLARVRTSTRRTTGRRQTIDRDAVVEWLKLNPGAKAGDISEGVRFKVPSNVLTELVQEGRLKKTGEKRGTKYSAA